MEKLTDDPDGVLQSLVDRANSEREDYWDLVDEVIATHGRERMRDRAAQWCRVEEVDPALSALTVVDAHGAGLNLLGIVAVNDSLAADLVLEFAGRLRKCSDQHTRWATAVALGRLGRDPERLVTQYLIELVADSDSDVRWAAVHALSSRTHEEPDEGYPEVVAALRLAMADVDPEVRDWATFALGVARDADSPEIRELFLRALQDDGPTDEDAEAALALARRKDPRVVPEILWQLEFGGLGNLWVEAAGEIADRRCLPLLRALQRGGLFDGEHDAAILSAAIERCEATTRAVVGAAGDRAGRKGFGDGADGRDGAPVRDGENPARDLTGDPTGFR